MTALDSSNKATVYCHTCNTKCEVNITSTGKSRVPQGWKRIPDDLDNMMCGECWKQKYVLRAVSIPVFGPDNGTWEELREELREAWGQSTAIANAVISALWAEDLKGVRAARAAGETKCPKAPNNINLYAIAKQTAPNAISANIATITQAVSKKYKAKRYDIVWTGESSLPSFRYPYPYSISNQRWKLEVDDKGPVIIVRLPTYRWNLRLRTGPRYRRQLIQLKKIADGSAVQGELVILRQRAKDGKITDRPSNNQRVKFDTIVKIIAWFPRPAQPRERSGSLMVRSVPDALLVAVNSEDQRIWTLNFDHVRRWHSEHKKRLQRLAEDQKAEQRPVPSFIDRRRQQVEKHNNRMSSAINEASRQLVNFAVRRRVTEIVYDNTDQSYASSFPWQALKTRIKTLCNEAKIDLHIL